MKKITQKHIKKFKEYLANEEKSINTIEKYLRDVTAFAIWSADMELTKAVVLSYKEHLSECEYAPRSINSILSSLNSFFDFFDLYKFKVKMLKIQKQIFADKEKELAKAEYERLLNAAKQKGNEELYLIMQTICGLGIRVSELVFITKESLTSKKAIINLKGKIRVVMIPDDLCKILLNYAKEMEITSGSIFTTKKGKPIDRTQIWRQMKALCKSANVSREKVFPHNLRHLFARTYYSLQKDIVKLADILGHSSVNTTRIYTMESGEEHRKTIQKLGLLRL